jgi:hypothetical protein
LVERDVDETLGREKEDGSKYGPCGRWGDGGGGDSRTAQESGGVDVVSWTGEMKPGAGAKVFDGRVRESCSVKESDLKYS